MSIPSFQTRNDPLSHNWQAWVGFSLIYAEIVLCTYFEELPCFCSQPMGKFMTATYHSKHSDNFRHSLLNLLNKVPCGSSIRFQALSCSKHFVGVLLSSKYKSYMAFNIRWRNIKIISTNIYTFHWRFLFVLALNVLNSSKVNSYNFPQLPSL